jgi:prepilin-type N-terminal cleavage/methylation domain-containing protein
MTGRCKKMKKIYAHNGFTLIELMVVLVIAGILMGLAIPSIYNFRSTASLTESSQGIKFDIAQTLTNAARLGMEYQIDFSEPDEAHYQITRVNMGVTEQVKTEALKTGTTFAGKNAIRFSGTGQIIVQPNPIVIRNKKALTTIVVMNATGEVIIR